MSQTHFLRRNWKLILNIVTIGALIVLIYAIRDQIATTLRNIEHVHAWVLLLMIPIELLNYHAQARLYQRLFQAVGNRLDYWYLYKMSVELNFVNHVFPSGGVTGLSYFGVRLRENDDVSGGKATMIQVMKLAMTLLSFEVLIVIGLFSLAVMGRANNLTILVAASLSTLLLVGTALFVYILGSRERINNFVTALTKALNRVILLIRRSNPETLNVSRVSHIMEDFHESYVVLRQDRQVLRASFLYALLANVTEVLVLYVVYIAFGHLVNIGAVILAYAVANFAGLISVLPGGVGIYEFLMTAVLATTGVPAAVSLPVTVMYRVLNTAIQLPPGYYLYHRNLVASGNEKRHADG